MDYITAALFSQYFLRAGLYKSAESFYSRDGRRET